MLGSLTLLTVGLESDEPTEAPRGEESQVARLIWCGKSSVP